MLLVGALFVVVAVMGSKKLAMGTKKKGSAGAGPSIGPVQLNKRPPASVDEEEERRKKQKRDEKEREEEEERQEWMRQVKKKGFTCERQVDRTKLAHMTLSR